MATEDWIRLVGEPFPELTAEATCTFSDPEAYQGFLGVVDDANQAAGPARFDLTTTVYEAEPSIGPLLRWRDWRALPGLLARTVGYHVRAAMRRPRITNEISIHAGRISYVGMERHGDSMLTTFTVSGQPDDPYPEEDPKCS